MRSKRHALSNSVKSGQRSYIHSALSVVPNKTLPAAFVMQQHSEESRNSFFLHFHQNLKQLECCNKIQQWWKRVSLDSHQKAAAGWVLQKAIKMIDSGGSP